MIEQQSPPEFFVQGSNSLVRVMVFSLLSIVLMVSDARWQYLGQVRQIGMTVMQPLYWMATRPEAVYQQVTGYFSAHSSLSQQLAQLQKQSLQQAAQLQNLNSLQQENDHLRGLLELPERVHFSVMPTQIITLLNNHFSHRVVIDRGTQQGVSAGQAVIDQFGVLGQVTRAYAHSSEVTLLTDNEFAVPIQVERNGLRAVAFGIGHRGHITLPYLPANVDLQLGDRLLTSGLDGVYPAGLMVAEITQVKVSNNSPFAVVYAKPLAGVHNFRQVLLVQANTPKPISQDADQAAKR